MRVANFTHDKSKIPEYITAPGGYGLKYERCYPKCLWEKTAQRYGMRKGKMPPKRWGEKSQIDRYAREVFLV